MRKWLLVGVAVSGVLLAASCGLLGGSDPPVSAGAQMGGPAFNNAGDNGPMVLLAVVVTVVLVAAGAMGLAMFRAWRDERTELRAELRRLGQASFPAGRRPELPQVNGRDYHYQPAEDGSYRQIGR